MKMLVHLLAITPLISINSFSSTTAPIDSNPKEQFTQDIYFIENKGQVRDQHNRSRPDILYTATDGQMILNVLRTGMSYQVYNVISWRTDLNAITGKPTRIPESSLVYRIDARWLNCNKNAISFPAGQAEDYLNFYDGNYPDGVQQVKSYRDVTVRQIYNGIDVRYYGKGGKLKFDLVVTPGGDYRQIKMQVKGAKIKVRRDGGLLLETPVGAIEQGAPIVFQGGKQLKAKWILSDDVLSYLIEDFDPRYQMIIDPIVRLWGTYYAGQASSDYINSCSTDVSGNVYIAGTTMSTGTNVATSGAYQATLAGNTDAYLAKFNSSGVRLWGTYYGGSAADRGNGCRTDASGNVYLTGATSSSAGIATSGSHQSAVGGGTTSTDAFLVKFNSAGVRQWGTYYGGNDDDDGFGCVIDASGNVYLAGLTRTSTGTIIATTGSHQSSPGGNGLYDAYLAKFDASGVRQWGTYYGGSSSEYAHSIAMDPWGNIYIAGRGSSTTGISSSGGHQVNFSGGNDDAFLAKFNASGVRQWGTYYGGPGDESGYCATDPYGNVFLGGSTSSSTSTLIATLSSYQSSYGGGTRDSYLARFDSSGVRQWATYFGGSGDDPGAVRTTDPSGNVFISGLTSSTAGIATSGAYQSTHSPTGFSDGFLVKFSANGVCQWGTYYGGTGEEATYECSTDGSGNVYLGGISTSTTSVATSGSHLSTQLSGGNYYSGLLVKFFDCEVPSVSLNHSDVLCPNYSTGSASAAVTGTASYTFTWIPSGGNSTTAGGLTVGNYSVIVSNTCGTSLTRTVSISATNVSPTVTVNSGSVCSGLPFILTPTGAATYTFSSGSNTITSATSGTYSVVGTSSAGCISSNTAISTVTVFPSPVIAVNSGSICSGQSFTLSPTGASTFSFSGGAAIVSPQVNTSYSVTGTSTSGCISLSPAVVTVSVFATPTVVVNSGSICSGQFFTLTPAGASTFTFSGGSAIVSPQVNTSYSVTGTNTAGCISLSPAVATVSVFVTPTVVVNSGSICSGQTFTITPGGAYSYSITGGSFVVSPATTTSFTLSGTSQDGCNSATNAVSTVTVDPLPNISVTPSISTICLGESATLTATGAASYHWQNLSSGFSLAVAPTITTVYTVTGFGADGCSSVSQVTLTVDECTGIRHVLNLVPELKIYPNPTENRLWIENAQDCVISLVNALGQIILSQQPTDKVIVLSMEQLPSGVYFLNVQSNDRRATTKIVKRE